MAVTGTGPDEDIWVSMIKDRNLSSHTYNEDLAQEIAGRVNSYLPVITATLSKLKETAKTC